MASSSPSPPHSHHHHHHPKKKKSNFASALALPFSLFLFGVFFFSKRSLEPSASIYSDLSFPVPTTPHSSSQSDHLSPPLESAAENLPAFKAAILDSESPSAASEITISIPTAVHEPKAGVFENGSMLAPSGRIISTRITAPEPKIVNRSSLSSSSSVSSPSSGINVNVVELGSSGKQSLLKKNAEKCDFYRGRWVKDREGRYPLYSPGSCPYVEDSFSCQQNGRRDEEYMRWRWKPDGCDLPRFNATNFLERLRGKTLMLVGDSMNRNQFESILCLLHESLPDKSKMFETGGYKINRKRDYFVVKFSDYNCTVEYSRSHFLVREGARLDAQGKTRPSLLIDRVDNSSSRWKHADLLIFNNGHWWTERKTFGGKDFYKEGDKIYPKLDHVKAYRRAMKTWAAWVDKNMDARRTKVFFRGHASAYFRGGRWYSGGKCSRETKPAFRGPVLSYYPWKMRVTEDVIRRMRFPVILLNVTRLTNFRKDAHPSIYGDVRGPGMQDCSHWCLPGVPDVWNELIYANLLLEQMQAKGG